MKWILPYVTEISSLWVLIVSTLTLGTDQRLAQGNILVTDDERAILCDFGLATVMDDELTALATSNEFKGSTRWCSPEVLSGESRSPSTDMWSWGCLALEVAGWNY